MFNKIFSWVYIYPIGAKKSRLCRLENRFWRTSGVWYGSKRVGWIDPETFCLKDLHFEMNNYCVNYY